MEFWLSEKLGGRDRRAIPVGGLVLADGLRAGAATIPRSNIFAVEKRVTEGAGEKN